MSELRVLMVSATVDHGTRSIAEVYHRELRPFDVIEIPSSLASHGLKGMIKLRVKLRNACKNADVVVCLHHGAIIAGALFIPSRPSLRCVAVADWTRAYPSLRTDTYIKVYNPIFNRLLKKFNDVYSPALKFCDFYQSKHGINVEETLYPLPYVDQVDHKTVLNSTPSLLFIGADYRRKGGDALLEAWKANSHGDAELTFVCPSPPECSIRNVVFRRNIVTNTPEHLEILKSHEVFVLPSRREAFGYAALEALFFGQLVVTTRQAGISALVLEAGGLVGESPEEAVQIAIQLLSDKNEIRERRDRIQKFMATYPERFDACLRHILTGSGRV